LTNKTDKVTEFDNNKEQEKEKGSNDFFGTRKLTARHEGALN
jgi:hypothetical protein